MDKKSNYHELTVDIKNCKTEKELLKVIQYIDQNRKKLKLDEYDIEKLEAIGLRRYEEMTRERNIMVKNKRY
jgi:hypothetical protein